MGLDYQKQKENSEEIERNEAENAQPVATVTPYYSIILISCIIFVSFIQISTNLPASVQVAGFDKPLFVNGEYWRILTGASLHGGLIHLLFNSYALFVLGRLVEILSNRSHLAIVFLLSAVGGGLLSLLFLPDGTSVGASGGIIGLLGYLAVYGYRRRELLSNAFLKNMLVNIGIITVIGLIAYQSIDNFGHLGGLITGAIYGFLQIPSDLHKDPREVGNTTKTLGYIALGIFILTSIFSIILLVRNIGFSLTFLR